MKKDVKQALPWQKWGGTIIGILLAYAASGQASDTAVVAPSAQGWGDDKRLIPQKLKVVERLHPRRGQPKGQVSTFFGKAKPLEIGNISGIALDAEGNVYTADDVHHLIRKTTPAGEWSSLAGSAGEWDMVDGRSTAARFNRPKVLIVGPDGTVYVADQIGHCIRKVSPAGLVTTLAGQVPGKQGPESVTGSAFGNVGGAALGVDGSLYVADLGSHAIWRISAAGQVSLLAGKPGEAGAADGPSGQARFQGPTDVTVRADGTVFVADAGNLTLRCSSPTGQVSTLAGLAKHSGRSIGRGPVARFSGPASLALAPDGTIYVADQGRLRRVTADGLVKNQAELSASDLALGPGGRLYTVSGKAIRTLGSRGLFTTLPGPAGFPQYADGQGAEARFSSPSGIAVAKDGTVYITDSGNMVVRKITPTGIVSTLAGAVQESGSADGRGSEARFIYPNGVAVAPDGTLYVTDQNAVRKITPAGQVTTLAGSALAPADKIDGPGPAARFNSPRGIAVAANGTVYVADAQNGLVRAISPLGQVSTVAISKDSDESFYPQIITVDANGTLYVLDNNQLIRKIAPNGSVKKVVLKIDSTSKGDSTGGNGLPISLMDLAAATDVTLYAFDGGSYTIGMILPDGTWRPLAGASGQPGGEDGVGTAARFGNPIALTVDQHGIVYAVDASNGNVRRILPTGAVSTLAGPTPNSGTAYLNLGNLVASKRGQLFVLDPQKRNIREITPTGPGRTVVQFGPPLSDGWGGTQLSSLGMDKRGNFYVAENTVVYKITASGKESILAGKPNVFGHIDGPAAGATLGPISALAVRPNGTVYVLEGNNPDTMRVISPQGVVTTRTLRLPRPLSAVAGAEAAEPGWEGDAIGAAVGQRGIVYKLHRQAIHKILPDGTTVLLAGPASSNAVLPPGTWDGLGAQARFGQLQYFGVDRRGTLYVTDGHSVRTVSSAGMVTTLAGFPTGYGSADGPGVAARFRQVQSLAVDGRGRVYLLDAGNGTVRTID